MIAFGGNVIASGAKQSSLDRHGAFTPRDDGPHTTQSELEELGSE